MHMYLKTLFHICVNERVSVKDSSMRVEEVYLLERSRCSAPPVLNKSDEHAD